MSRRRFEWYPERVSAVHNGLFHVTPADLVRICFSDDERTASLVFNYDASVQDLSERILPGVVRTPAVSKTFFFFFYCD